MYVNLRTYRTNPLSPNDPVERYRVSISIPERVTQFPAFAWKREGGGKRDCDRDWKFFLPIAIVPSTGYPASRDSCKIRAKPLYPTLGNPRETEYFLGKLSPQTQAAEVMPAGLCWGF